MRQQIRSGHLKSIPLIRLSALLICLILVGSGNLFAAIEGLTLEVQTNPAEESGKKFNSGVVVTLNSRWTRGDTPPFGATYSMGGTTLGSEITSQLQSTLMRTGSELGHGDGKAFGVSVIETSVPNPTPVTANGDKSINIDLIPPVISVAITGGQSGNFSNTPPNNQLTIVVSSDKDILPPTMQVSEGAQASPQPDAGNPATGRSFRYTMTLTTASPGNYTITATCKDTTLPEANANSGAGSSHFNVTTAGPQSPSITAVNPPSPSKSQNITLSGSMAAGTVAIGVYENDAKVADGTINGQNWSASISNVTEGNHKYTARSTDNLGNVSGDSAAFDVKIDLTSPHVPALTQPTSPTNAEQISVSGTEAKDIPGTDNVTSLPVYVELFRSDGTSVASIPVNADGTFTFTNVPLVEGSNSFMARSEDSANGPPGNQSGYSNVIIVVRDVQPSNASALVLAKEPSLASTPIPIPDSTYIAVGDYSLQVNFDKAMDQNVKPTIAFKPANGAEVSSTAGTWVSATSYVGIISVPSGQGSTYDGVAGIRVFGAKDTAGNTMAEKAEPAAFHIDSTPPTTSMSMDPIYVASSTSSIPLTGTSNDNLSGVGYVKLVWQSFAGGEISSVSIPIFNGVDVNWSYNWDVSALPAGRYKLWAHAADQGKPEPNIEKYEAANYRIVLVDRDEPIVTRISIDDLNQDISAMDPANPIPTIASAVTKLSARINPGGANSEVDFDSPNFIFTLVHDQTNTNIEGNKSNNASDTIFFTFPQLTANGTYTVSVRPVNKAGNVANSVATRSFILDTDGPGGVTFFPPTAAMANRTYPSLAADQVWATIDDNNPDYGKSKIEVTYNGLSVGNQIASTSELVWDILGAVATLPVDQSYDGRFDIVVTPRDTLGNVGDPVRSHFYYDSNAPVVTKFEPSIDIAHMADQGTWIGLLNTTLSVTFSDAPKDIITFYNTIGTPKAVAGDSTWQNGTGSGVEIATCSLIVIVNGEISSGTVSGTNKISLDRPGLPEDQAPGMIDMPMTVESADKVTHGEVIPNKASWNYTYKFDYLAPSITFSNPIDAGKYCKQQIKFDGAVKDNGTSDEIMVKKAEVSLDQNAWYEVTGNLPSKTASWSYLADVATLTDGNYKVYGRSYDLGGNVSTTVERAFVIDRTPPVPPTLILPLNDSIHQARGHKFKWSKVTDADRYLVQIADDAGFNNILNHQAVASYSGLTGQIVVSTEASYSVPKDGTYYWRVAAIETCIDGYNISSFSSTWRVMIDTVKPKVLEVQPTPSSGNKITTGMVTFSIRFSENMDTTIPPIVSLTSAGGQLMLVEQLTFKDNTWIGTTVIPKNQSALYDGNAVIAISGAKDMAANEMEADSTNIVVINTGPAFETKIFSNPAHLFEITVVTRSSEALQAPPTCSVTQSSVSTPVTMNFLKERYYAGSYRIDPDMPGTAYIDISGTDLYGMVGKGSVEFTVADINPNVRLTLTTADGQAEIRAAPGTVSQSSAIYMISRKDLESPFSSDSIMARTTPSVRRGITADASANSELVEIMALDEIGPVSLKLSKKMLYISKIKLPPGEIAPEKIHLYRFDGSRWIYCGGEIVGDQISAEISGTGRFALLADLKPPSLVEISPSENEKIIDSIPLIEGCFDDAGSGLDYKSLRLAIDGRMQPGVIINQAGRFSYQVKTPLAKGQRRIEISINDSAGNTTLKSFFVDAPGPFAIDEFMAYPNPTRGEDVWFNYNFQQRADDLKLRIYDTAGHKVAHFETFDFINLISGKIRWDLRNQDGRKVSNGVYFYKLEVTKNGQTLKHRGKFAVLR